ncbi:hypothetical protein [Saccharothrix syringae]|uniref:Uncharacterized protein n=1 Tax=Saccharothrix syringae TaxID=103733 RepID=A0A5Q0H8Z7_SACSY|nr:hypothetical protein [Saccharothrix syringae]QFZ22142.1 hypothetical protein EKG83_36260 [Saccharothrix syringae]
MALVVWCAPSPWSTLGVRGCERSGQPQAGLCAARTGGTPTRDPTGWSKVVVYVVVVLTTTVVAAAGRKLKRG